MGHCQSFEKLRLTILPLRTGCVSAAEVLELLDPQAPPPSSPDRVAKANHAASIHQSNQDLWKTQSTRHHKGIIDVQQKSSCVAFSNMPRLLPAYILCAFSMLRCLKRSASMRPHCNPPGTKRRQKIRWNLKHPEFFSLECICMALQ